jgi:hypothetical protein
MSSNLESVWSVLSKCGVCEKSISESSIARLMPCCHSAHNECIDDELAAIQDLINTNINGIYYFIVTYVTSLLFVISLKHFITCYTIQWKTCFYIIFCLFVGKSETALKCLSIINQSFRYLYRYKL